MNLTTEIMTAAIKVVCGDDADLARATMMRLRECDEAAAAAKPTIEIGKSYTFSEAQQLSRERAEWVRSQGLGDDEKSSTEDGGDLTDVAARLK
jgi:hypothetical protein